MATDDRAPAPPRLPPVLAWPVAGCVGGVLGLRLLPELPLGHTVFDLLRLNLTWPVFVPLLTYVFWRIGARRQAALGEPTFAPGQAAAAGAVIVLAVFFLLGVWGAEWPLWWWVVSLAVLAAGGAMLVVGWFAYSETWRTAFNRAVMGSVEKQIRRHPDRFIREVERRRDGRAATVEALDWIARKSGTAPGRLSRVLRWAEGRAREWVAAYDHAWGSPHALAVLEGNYADARHDLTRAAEQPDGGLDDDRLLDDFVSAGECLAAYLTLDWPPGTVAAESATARRFAVFHELIVATVAFATPPRQTDFSRALLGRVPDWLAGFHAAAPGCERFREVFEWIVVGLSAVGGKVETAGGDDEIAAERELVSRVLVEYHRLDDDPPPAEETDARALIAEAWLALASRVDAAARLDAWEVMAESLPDAPAVSPSLPATLARAGLVELTVEAERRTPARWRSGMTGRRKAAAGQVPAARPDAVRRLFERSRPR